MIKYFNKLNPKNRFYIVFTMYVLVQILAFITAPLFPIYFQLRHLGKFNPFWVFLDDTRFNDNGSLAEDYRIYLRDFKWKPLGVFMWHISRNRAWNFIELFPVDDGDPEFGLQDIEITNLIDDSLTKYNGDPLMQDGPYPVGAGLKYVGEPGDDPWQVNRGDIISKKHSIIGSGEIEYKTNSGWTGWRKTSCNLENVWWMFGAKRWVTRFRGMNANRHSFKQKYQKDKPWGLWPE